MSKKSNKGYTFFVFLCMFTVIILFWSFISYINITFKNKRSMFYVDIINKEFPILKVTEYDDENMAENSANFKDALLNFIGLNLKNPITVLNREVALINIDNMNTLQLEKLVKIVPYQLSDKEITLNESGQTEPVNTTPTPSTNDSNSQNTTSSTYDKTLKKAVPNTKPDILIYHTHTSESYSPGPIDTSDQTKSVCAVGDALQQSLVQDYGISVINDKTVHDQIAYTQSYAKSRVTVNKYLKQYSDFRMILDIHRDSIENKKEETISLNGENVAKFMIVMCEKNPHYAKNNALALKIQQISDKLFPGLCKGFYNYNYGTLYFNQDLSNNAILIEVGSNVNTTVEAKNTSKYLARIIAEILNR